MTLLLLRGDYDFAVKVALWHQLPALKMRYVILFYILRQPWYWSGTVAKAVCMYSEMLSEDTKSEPHCKIKALHKTLIQPTGIC